MTTTLDLPTVTATTVDGYMEDYGVALGTEARRLLRPLHDPSVDMPSAVALKRPPFPAQAHVSSAVAKCLDIKQACIVVGEMGTGKTFIALMSILEYMDMLWKRGVHQLGFRTIVMCPGHLVHKWVREINETVPNANVVIVSKWTDMIAYHARMKRKRPLKPTFFVMSRDTAKLGPGWHPVYKLDSQKGCCRCVKCGNEILDKDNQPIGPSELEKNKTFCPVCNDHLWSYDTERVRKWMPSRYIKKKMKGYFDFLILDEAHEEKSATSEQAIAAGCLMAATKKQIILTGTIIGGYAEDIRPMLFRMCGRKMRERGYTWKGSMQFVRDYGRIDTIITKSGDENGGSSKTGHGKSSSSSKREQARPGIMPPLFGDLLMDWTVFISLNEISENLPSFSEQVIPVNMDADQQDAYSELEKALSDQARDMMAKGDRRLLATMLQTLLTYPDHPFDWKEVGYWDKPKARTDFAAVESNQKIESGPEEGVVDRRKKKRKSVVKQDKGEFVAVCQPPNLEEDRIYPKEQALIDLVTSEKLQGRQVWVYVQNTNKHDMLKRLKKVLSEAGLNAMILRSETVKPINREKWIYENGRGVDVMISHPKLVQTGMDLFDKGGNHNFVSLVFYQTGYETVVLRQASRRSWRIGQTKICKVYYMYYAKAMQSSAMELMGNKIKASIQVEGKFSAEGLAQMCDDVGGIEMALAKKLANMEAADDNATIRAWEKIGNDGGHVSLRETIIEDEAVHEDDELPDDLTMEQALEELNKMLAAMASSTDVSTADTGGSG